MNAVKRCWSRDITEYIKANEKKGENEMIENHEEMMRDLEEFAKERSIKEPTILDSGDRTEFESGAVRDMRVGKGRCDLLPLDVVCEYLELYINRNASSTLIPISHFMKDGDSEHLYESLYIFTLKVEAFELSHPTMFLEVAKHFEDGAKKYGDNNWRKGIPTNVYIDSAVRHYLKYLRGDKDERHDRAFVWNILCCIWTCVHIPELNTYAKDVDDGGLTINESVEK